LIIAARFADFRFFLLEGPGGIQSLIIAARFADVSDFFYWKDPEHGTEPSVSVMADTSR
jgi:hypothetical protein